MLLSLAARGPPHRHRLAVDQDLAGDAAEHAEERQQQVALALAVESAEADDLAGADAQRDVLQPVGPGEVARLQHRRLVARHLHRLRREDVAVFAADHQLDDLGVGLRAGLVGRDVAAVAEHRALVGELGDLLHAVRDVEDAEPLVPQPLQHREHLGDVGGGQRRGRLVEDEDGRIARQRLGDLHHLLARERQLLHRRERMDVLRAGARQRRLGEASLRAPVDQPEAPSADC